MCTPDQLLDNYFLYVYTLIMQISIREFRAQLKKYLALEEVNITSRGNIIGTYRAVKSRAKSGGEPKSPRNNVYTPTAKSVENLGETPKQKSPVYTSNSRVKTKAEVESLIATYGCGCEKRPGEKLCFKHRRY